MQIEIFSDGGDFCVRLPGSPMVVRWFRRAGTWMNVREKLSGQARKVEFGDLPDDLREEILAFVARAEAMGNQIWKSQN